MNTFNESNTIEAMLIEAAQKAGWDYVPIADVPRNESQILVEPWLVEALRRLNPTLTPAQIDEVVIKLRTVCVAATRDELVTANQRFRKLLFEENSYPFGEDGMHVNVRFFDEERPENNRCVITNQWEFPRRSAQGGKRYDIVMVVNGIPMVICETKTPVRPSETWANAAQDMVWYQGCTPEMFVPNALCLATEGKELFYAGIGTPAAKWGPWFRDESRPHGDLASVAGNFRHLVDPKRILDIYRYYSLFTTVNDRKVKIVCRYQQYHGGEAIVQRVLKGYPKKGLIWHFQGSGKSWLMVFAAQKLRNMAALENPTVVIVDDRVDLEDQITGDFTRAEIPNLAKAGSREELETFFREDQRMILITTIFKFGEVQGELSDRNNIILLVDEAHRTQEGDLGVRMRMALPNAFFFGLTGTPINRRDINTFNTFGAKEDEGGYMSKYSFQDSIDDVAKSLAFDDKNVKKVVKNIEEIKAQIPSLMAKCLAFFPNIDRTVGGYNGLLAAQECLRDDKVKDNFAAHYATLHRAWEIVAPDIEIERAFKTDYVWLTNVFDSVRPPSGGGGGLIWTLLGPKTIELIHQNVERIDIGDSLEELVLNSQVLDEFIDGIKDKGKPIIDIVKILEIRLWKNRKNPKIKKLAEKLDELREKMRQNLIESIEFLKELLKMAREVLTIEKEENQPEDRRRQARAALTELFESIKSPEMPIIVENVVNDIDTQVVEIVRKFRETFETVTGQNEVKKRLRSILWLKYQIKDPEVFEKAYSYVEQYYN